MLSILCLIVFLLNKTSLNFLNSVPILTLFAVFYFVSSIFYIEYIFDFNPTNSTTKIPSNSSFILPITFLLVSLKNFESLNDY